VYTVHLVVIELKRTTTFQIDKEEYMKAAVHWSWLLKVLVHWLIYITSWYRVAAIFINIHIDGLLQIIEGTSCWWYMFNSWYIKFNGTCCESVFKWTMKFKSSRPYHLKLYNRLWTHNMSFVYLKRGAIQ